MDMVGAWSPVVWEASPLTTLVSDGIVPVAHSVSIPGGKPLHEPPKVFLHGAVIIDRVSIPGGKPLHEPLLFQLLSGVILRVSIPGGKPLHEPRNLCQCCQRISQKFQSQAGSPSPSHRPDCALKSSGFQVSIPGGKPLHEPRPLRWRKRSGHISFNPRREAPPRATRRNFLKCESGKKVSIPGGKPLHEPPEEILSSANLVRKFQSQAGSPSTSHQKKFYQVRIW